MISDVREKGSLIEVYDANSKRISYMSAGSKELVGVASNFFVVINSSLIEGYDEKYKRISYMSKESKIVRGAAGNTFTVKNAKELVTKALSSYTAIDFETAQGKRWRICQVGLVRVENQVITEQLSILVQPPDSYYWNNFIDIHGISPELTANAPTFSSIWYQIEPLLQIRMLLLRMVLL